MRGKRIVAVIPARMGASRFPGKPLAMILDLPMIEHVRRRVCLSEAIDEVVVATCDQEIADTVERFGGLAVMTAATHERCTDRVEEASEQLDMDIAVVVQGDEPLFDPDVLQGMVEPFFMDEQLQCTNLLSLIRDNQELHNVDVVKAVLTESKDVLFYSRSPVPYRRADNDCPLYRQTGVSAFTKDFLHTFSALTPTVLEVAESVDFLRILGHGYAIRSVIFDGRLCGVDRPDDIPVVENILQNDSVQKQLYARILQL